MQLAELRVLSRFVRCTKSATTLRPQLQALCIKVEMKNIISILEEYYEPIEGNRYALSVELKDGTILHRVIFTVSKEPWKLAEGSSSDLEGNFLDCNSVKEIQPSKHAFPKELYGVLSDPVERLEYSYFSLELKTGEKIYFDLNDECEFFGIPEFIDIPEGYCFSDVISAQKAVYAPKGVKAITYGLEPVFYCHLYRSKNANE